MENITPNIRFFIWRQRWAISKLRLTLITRRVTTTQPVRPVERSAVNARFAAAEKFPFNYFQPEIYWVENIEMHLF